MKILLQLRCTLFIGEAEGDDKMSDIVWGDLLCSSAEVTLVNAECYLQNNQVISYTSPFLHYLILFLWASIPAEASW